MVTAEESRLTRKRVPGWTLERSRCLWWRVQGEWGWRRVGRGWEDRRGEGDGIDCQVRCWGRSWQKTLKERMGYWMPVFVKGAMES